MLGDVTVHTKYIILDDCTCMTESKKSCVGFTYNVSYKIIWYFHAYDKRLQGSCPIFLCGRGLLSSLTTHMCKFRSFLMTIFRILGTFAQAFVSKNVNTFKCKYREVRI